jgi:hypothetical protein
MKTQTFAKSYCELNSSSQWAIITFTKAKNPKSLKTMKANFGHVRVRSDIKHWWML